MFHLDWSKMRLIAKDLKLHSRIRVKRFDSNNGSTLTSLALPNMKQIQLFNKRQKRFQLKA